MELISPAAIDIPAALNRRALRELSVRLDETRDAALILRGGPEVFCEGMDFAELDCEAGIPAGLELYAECLQKLRRHPRPVIAVVEGRALAGGLGLVAACDVAIASEQATFSLSELLFGMMPAVVLPFLLERVPPQKARLWAIAARTLTAAEACQIGLIDEVAMPHRLERTVQSWTRAVSRANPEAVAGWKNLTAGFAIRGLPEATKAGAERMADPDVKSAIRRFVEEGVAPWH